MSASFSLVGFPGLANAILFFKINKVAINIYIVSVRKTTYPYR